MKKNLYYRSQLSRHNVLVAIVVSMALKLASYPKLLLEVFIRKNFGERYFKLISAISVAVLLLAWSVVMVNVNRQLYGGSTVAYILKHELSLYVFLALFMQFSFRRNREIKKNPSVFDFAKFSIYSGDHDPRFYRYGIPGRKTDQRLVETLLEPAPFFIVGIALWILQQRLGSVLVVSSLIYCLSYIGAYMMGDSFVMNQIDEMICNEELERSFVDDIPPEDARGFRFTGRKPADPDHRRKVAASMIEEDETVDAY